MLFLPYQRADGLLLCMKLVSQWRAIEKKIKKTAAVFFKSDGKSIRKEPLAP